MASHPCLARRAGTRQSAACRAGRSAMRDKHIENPCAASGVVQADQGAAMRASVLERRDRPIGIACDHHRHLPDHRRSPVARIGDFVFQAQEIPHRPLEHQPLLEFPQPLVAIHPERYARKVAGPAGKRSLSRQKRIGHRYSPQVGSDRLKLPRQAASVDKFCPGSPRSDQARPLAERLPRP